MAVGCPHFMLDGSPCNQSIKSIYIDFDTSFGSCLAYQISLNRITPENKDCKRDVKNKRYERNINKIGLHSISAT